MDSMHHAKGKGADVVKQWDSTLDGRTRYEHTLLDGQIRELDEEFEVAGMKAQYPGGFATAYMDCNCRCAMLQRARWALDADELKTLQDRAAYYGLDKTADFEDFKKKYLQCCDNGGIISGGVSGALNPDSVEARHHAKRYYASVRKMTTDVRHIAENTGYSQEQIQAIKNFIFMEKHDLDGKLDYFHPSYRMAESWQRLIEGKNIQPHDLTLLRLEMMERELMLQGYPQDEAHIITSRRYNYNKESEDYYAKISKHSKD